MSYNLQISLLRNKPHRFYCLLFCLDFFFTAIAEEELANERDQIPPPPPPQELAVGHCYEVLPLSAYSPSDFMVRLSAKQGEFLSLMCELRQIYLEWPSWLRIRASDASRHIPIAYVSDDNYVGRGYVAVELVNDICIVYEVDDGTFNYVN